MKLLGLFAKYWQAGRVKTRLAADVGADNACLVYRAMLASIVSRFRQTANRRCLIYSPRDSEFAFQELAGTDWEIIPQTEGDLGVRMQGFFDAALAAGAERVVLIGADSPTIPISFLDQAFHALDNRDVVLGPSHDGGYYLIGIGRQVPTIFDQIDWSTPHVWRQTLDRLSAQRIAWHALPAWYDVDELGDLERLVRELEQSPDLDSELGRLLSVTQQVLRTRAS